MFSWCIQSLSTDCASHIVLGSQSAHLTVCSPHRVLGSQYARLTVCSPHRVLGSQYARLTLCSALIVLGSHCARLTLCSTVGPAHVEAAAGESDCQLQDVLDPHRANIVLFNGSTRPLRVEVFNKCDGVQWIPRRSHSIPVGEPCVSPGPLAANPHCVDHSAASPQLSRLIQFSSC